MKIALDGMGGDNAPDAVVGGAALALKRYSDLELILVGKKDRLQPYLKKHHIARHPRLSVEHAEQVVRMDEPSTVSIRSKKNSSITVCADLASKGHADAVVTAGHTGAAVAATKIKMRTLPGVERPAIATIMPSISGPFLLIDAGANTDCKPLNLGQFALMGEAFAKLAFSRANPSIGLLSIGEEDEKGNDLTKESFQLFSSMPINFTGNVEGKAVFQHPPDVIVCDGFVGNILLKASESMAIAVMTWLKELFTKNPIRVTSAILGKSAFEDLKAISDYEEAGGAPLLGLNGICIIGHGSSSSKAIMNAVRVAREMIRIELNSQISTRIKECGVAIKN